MKNTKNLSLRFSLGCIALASLFMYSCSKDLWNPNEQTITPEPDPSVQAAKLQEEYAKAKEANDALVLYHDSLQMCQGNNALSHDSAFYASMMNHFDNSYHAHDSLMNVHHNSMHGNNGGMNGNGMMNNSGNGMMNGSNGTMNNSDHMKCNINNTQYDEAVNSLHSRHASHHII